MHQGSRLQRLPWLFASYLPGCHLPQFRIDCFKEGISRLRLACFDLLHNLCDIAHPLNQQTRELLEDQIFAAYESELKKSGDSLASFKRQKSTQNSDQGDFEP